MVSAARVWGLVGVLALLGACKPEPAPPRNAVIRQPEAETPPPSPAPDNPAPEPSEVCRVTVDGGGVLRAVVITQSGPDHEAEVEDGRQLRFPCPPEIEVDSAQIVAEKTTHEVVNWKDVEFDRDDEGYSARVKMGESKDGLPSDWSDKRKKQFLADHSDWEVEEEKVTDEDEDEAEPRVRRKSVMFTANKLGWAQLKFRGPQRGKIELDPRKRCWLAPGVYELWVQSELNGEWKAAGQLVIEDKRGSYVVKMLAAPPWIDVSVE